MAGSRGWWWAGSGLALGLGCGPDIDPPTELDEFCGVAEPVQLLAVGEHDYPALRTGGLRQLGDRLVFGYATYAAGVSFPSYDPDDISTTTIYSTGPCGEDPLPIGEHIDVLRGPEDGYGDALVGCRSAAGDVLALDVEGGSPWLLLAAVGCTTFPFAGGIVGIQREPGEAFGRLVFRPDLADPDAWARVVLEGIVMPETDPERPSWSSVFFSATDQHVLVVTRDGELVAIDPRVGDPVVLRANVRAFSHLTDSRWVLWQEGPPGTTPPDGEGTIRVLDLESGEDVYEDRGIVEAFRWADRDTLRLERPGGSTQLVLLPSLLALDVDPGLFVSYRHSTGVVVLGTIDPEPQIELIGMDPDSGEMWSIGQGDGWQSLPDGDLVIWRKHEEWDASYWRAFVRGGEPELLAEHTYWPVWLTNGRLGSVRNIDGSDHGELWIHDPETDELTFLDRGVYRQALGPRTSLGYAWPYDDDVIAWSVHGNGRRSGLWAARVK